MFDSIVELIAAYPYVTVAVLFVLCGMGLPLPEELVLLAAGYVCAKFPGEVALPWMLAWSGGAILAGDLIPFVLGRVFGTRFLRLRWMRMLVTKQRLAKFDHWFRKRGDLVIFIARFLAGIRMVAFFTAGTMKMPWRRFLLLDGLGIVVIVPALTYLGYRGAGVIDDVIDKVQRVERGILITALSALVVAGGWLWLWRRSRTRRQRKPVEEGFVQPRRPVAPGSRAAMLEPLTGDPFVLPQPGPRNDAGGGTTNAQPPAGPPGAPGEAPASTPRPEPPNATPSAPAD